MNLAKDIVFTTPDWVTDAGDWALHIPFAFWLMETCRPGIVVEDPGTSGDSYFAFCQAAAKLGLGTRCLGFFSRSGIGEEKDEGWNSNILSGAKQQGCPN